MTAIAWMAQQPLEKTKIPVGQHHWLAKITKLVTIR